MKKAEYIPAGFNLLKEDEIVREGDYYWNHRKLWLLVIEDMIGYRCKFSIIRKKTNVTSLCGLGAKRKK